MAHNSQLGYGSAPNTPYREQQDRCGTYERPHTAESGRYHHYQNPSRMQTPSEGFRHRGNNEVFSHRDGRGNGGWSEDRLGGEQGVTPIYQQKVVENRRDPNSRQHPVDATRPYHISPVSQFKEPRFDHYQNQEPVHSPSRQGVTQPRPIPHQELPREPNFDYEVTNTDADRYNMRNDRIYPRARPLIDSSVVSKSMVDYERGEPARSTQQQDYAELYHQESFYGNDGRTSDGLGTSFTRARGSDGRAQVQYSGPQQGVGKAHSKPSAF